MYGDLNCERCGEMQCPETSRTNPVKAIRLKCIDCSGGSKKEVQLCTARNCALYPFRMGRNPFRSVRELSEEQRIAAAERLAKARVKNA